MKKQIVLCGLIFSSYIFGMEKYHDSLELKCPIQGPGSEIAYLPVTFKKTFPGACPPLAAIAEHASSVYFDVQLPEDAYTYLSGNQRTYAKSFLPKQRTVEALESLLGENDNQSHIIMTVYSSHVPKEIPLLGQYSFLIKTAELPRSIKERCNITSLSKIEMQQYILIPWLCFCALLAYFAK